MSSPLETMATPLCFPIDHPGLDAPEAPGDRTQRGRFRSLSVMQKEALITSGSGRIWRVASDEGPYLDGADVAPPPLAFMSAGLVSAAMGALRDRAEAIDPTELELVLDTFYSISGSALRGTMAGTAHRPTLTAVVPSGTDREATRDLVEAAQAAAPTADLLASAHPSAFALGHNGAETALEGVEPLDGGLPTDPAPAFDPAPTPEPDPASPIIRHTGRKTEPLPEADDSYTDEDAAGYADDQDRTIHLRGHCTLDATGLISIEQRLYSPRGSVFEFTADEPAGERAPDALTYVAAGIGFCYMTQLGRYAEVVDEELTSYRLSQDTGFSGGRSAEAWPVRTGVFLDTPGDADFARDCVRMGEQTCYLHALCRTPDRLPAVAVSTR